ncbi:MULTISPECIES: DUF6223 family protein [unclassified Micromonospora]|uniref:DUF6223 family protein n=1 Tax=unclassified Micromonospora TaxID=2617518 RepID=UPI0022B6A7B4|nr:MULTISPECIES: DUF6223 family protein [unclassified Micromonospora]MCZ7422788.1 DUF6223 family protein [Verrucosispora sp. WMMA2121]WBB90526.1 DUF6223 family protein [Verrucosispora sp. WMMC514]
MMSVKLVLGTIVAAPSRAVGIAGPVDTYPAAQAVSMSAGRIGSTVAALLALAGVVVGVLALASGRYRAGRARAGLTALAAGAGGMALGGLVVLTSDSGIGTGNGRGGGYVALVVGLIAVVLGGVALARSRPAG